MESCAGQGLRETEEGMGMIIGLVAVAFVVALVEDVILNRGKP